MDATRQLVRLLLDVFSVEELRRFVRWSPEGGRLIQELPGGPVSANEFAGAVVDAWARFGYIDDALFDRIEAERPRRKPSIDAVREAFRATPRPKGSPEGGEGLREPKPPANDIQYLVAVALPLEQEAVSELLKETGDKTLPDGTVVGLYELQKDKRVIRIGLVMTGMGNESAALVVSSAVRELRPDAVAFVGIAGGLKEARVGDVVVATKVYGFDFGKGVEGGFQPRPEVGNTAYRFQQRAQFEAGRLRWLERLGPVPPPERRPRVHIKPIAAGSVRVASDQSDAAKRLAAYYGDALAVEMEGFGVLKALDQTRVEGAVVRGVSDRVAETIEPADATTAARNAAAFTLEVLANLS